MTLQECIAGMTDRIVKHFDPEKVILFGSHARGDDDVRSDVDLLVVLSHVDDLRKAAIAIRRALTDFPVGKDIIVTTPEEIRRRGHLVGTILRPALQEGKTLYARQ